MSDIETRKCKFYTTKLKQFKGQLYSIQRHGNQISDYTVYKFHEVEGITTDIAKTSLSLPNITHININIKTFNPELYLISTGVVIATQTANYIEKIIALEVTDGAQVGFIRYDSIIAVKD